MNGDSLVKRIYDYSTPQFIGTPDPAWLRKVKITAFGVGHKNG